MLREGSNGPTLRLGIQFSAPVFRRFYRRNDSLEEPAAMGAIREIRRPFFAFVVEK